jgi:imidazolonepropionase-like amidohydrolase
MVPSLFALCIFSSRSAAQTEVLSHVNVVDVVTGKIQRDRNVVMEAGVITGIRLQTDRLAAGARINDFTGGYVIPGLWDMHAHVGRLDRASLATFVASGVVGMRDVGEDDGTATALRDSIEAGSIIGPHLVLAGRTKSYSRPGSVVREAALTSNTSPLSGAAPNQNQSEGKFERFMRFVREGVAFTPTPVSLRADKSWREDLRLMAETGVMLLAGSDAGGFMVPAGFSVADQLISMVYDAGLTPLQSIQSATINAARWLGGSKQFGSVSEGHAADLVVLDRNPLDNISNLKEIRAVVRAGRVYDRIALDSLVLAQSH